MHAKNVHILQEDQRSGSSRYRRILARESLHFQRSPKQQLHLNDVQCKSIQVIIKKHEQLFDGELGYYPHEKFKLELTPGAQPVFKNA